MSFRNSSEESSRCVDFTEGIANSPEDEEVDAGNYESRDESSQNRSTRC